MKVLVFSNAKARSGSGIENTRVVAQLLEHDMAAQGKSYDDAIYNLQAMMAGHVVSTHQMGHEYTWRDLPAPKEDWDAWNEGQASIYNHSTFRFEGKAVELPGLEVRIGDDR